MNDFYPPKIITEYYPHIIDYRLVVKELMECCFSYATNPTPEKKKAINQLRKILVQKLEETT